MKHIKNNLVPVCIFLLAVISFYFADVSGKYLASEIYTRFIRNALFVLALILPISCGMGINFAIVVGAISAQMAIVFAIDLMLEGPAALLFTMSVSIFLSIVFGLMVAALLNRAKGREMIVSIMIGQLSSVLYQFVFMVAFGLIITPHNEAILLDRGIGVRSMIDAKNISSVIDGIFPFQLDGKTYSLFPLIIIAVFALLLFYIQRSRLGVLAKAVGKNIHTADLLGLKTNKIRSLCIVISTIFAAMSQILYVTDFGTVNVYTGHIGMDTNAAAAILVGGATLKGASMKNCFLGLILFHALFITSPMAGQNLFQNPSVGEYFRSFLAYGVIIIALIMNLKTEKKKASFA